MTPNEVTELRKLLELLPPMELEDLAKKMVISDLGTAEMLCDYLSAAIQDWRRSYLTSYRKT